MGDITPIRAQSGRITRLDEKGNPIGPSIPFGHYVGPTAEDARQIQAMRRLVDEQNAELKRRIDGAGERYDMDPIFHHRVRAVLQRLQNTPEAIDVPLDIRFSLVTTALITDEYVLELAKEAGTI